MELGLWAALHLDEALRSNPFLKTLIKREKVDFRHEPRTEGATADNHSQEAALRLDEALRNNRFMMK